MKQRDAVYNAVITAFAAANVDFEDGMNASPLISKEIRSEIHQTVINGFKTGEIEFEDTPSNTEKMSSDSKLSTYVSGLVSNWLRKDVRLNGNVKYTAKNPGSRVGSADPQLKALRQLAKQFETDPAKFAEIQTHIKTRVASLQSEKAKKVSIDLSALPASLKEELGLVE